MTKRKIFKVLTTVVLTGSLLLFFNGIQKEIKKKEIKVCVDENNWLNNCNNNVLNSNVTEEISNKLNINVKITILKEKNYIKELNNLLKSYDKPDVFLIKNAMRYAPIYAKQNKIISLDNLIKNSSNSEKINYFTDFYPLVSRKKYFITYNKPAAKIILVRQDLIYKHNLQFSNNVTTEEFFNEMMKIVLADKNIVPLSILKSIDNLHFFFNSFGANDDIYPKDGKFIDGFNTQEMKNALLYIKKLISNGIINKNFMKIENKEIRSSLINSNSAAILDYWFRSLYFSEESKNAAKYTDFKPIYKIIGPEGKGSGLIEDFSYGWAISKDCKNPDEAFKFIENQVFNPEIRQITTIGLKDIHYGINGQGYIYPKNEAKKSGYSIHPFVLLPSIPDFTNNTFKWFFNDEFLQKQFIISNEYYKNLEPNYPFPVAISEQYDKASLALNKFREDIIYKIISDEITLEKGYEEYKHYWQSINGDEMLNELNTAL